jgi:hypothetical protein
VTFSVIALNAPANPPAEAFIGTPNSATRCLPRVAFSFAASTTRSAQPECRCAQNARGPFFVSQSPLGQAAGEIAGACANRFRVSGFGSRDRSARAFCGRHTQSLPRIHLPGPPKSRGAKLRHRARRHAHHVQAAEGHIRIGRAPISRWRPFSLGAADPCAASRRRDGGRHADRAG